MTLRARKITINPVEHNALMIDGQLHVARNSIFGGGVMVEGELAVNHITAPVEWHTTEFGRWEMEPVCIVPAKLGPQDIVLTLPHHTHTFQSIPISFKKHKNGVRGAMVDLGINDRQSVISSRVVDDTVWEECPDEKIYNDNKELIYGNCKNGFNAAKSTKTVVGVYALDPILKHFLNDLTSAMCTDDKCPTGCDQFAHYCTTFCNGTKFAILFVTGIRNRAQTDWKGKYKGSEYIVAYGSVKEKGETEISGNIKCTVISEKEMESTFGWKFVDDGWLDKLIWR